MKGFVKVIDREGSGSAFPQEKVPQISMEKLKAGIFDGLQIKELMKDPIFDEEPSKAELSAYHSLKSVVTNFLGNHLSAEYEKEIEVLRKTFHQFMTRMSVKHSAVTLRLFSKELWRFE